MNHINHLPQHFNFLIIIYIDLKLSFNDLSLSKQEIALDILIRNIPFLANKTLGQGYILGKINIKKFIGYVKEMSKPFFENALIMQKDPYLRK